MITVMPFEDAHLYKPPQTVQRPGLHPQTFGKVARCPYTQPPLHQCRLPGEHCWRALLLEAGLYRRYILLNTRRCARRRHKTLSNYIRQELKCRWSSFIP